jgi:hypothetical protein
MTINRTTALMLVAVGPLAFVGGAIHPHAPGAQTMAEVAYVRPDRRPGGPLMCACSRGGVLRRLPRQALPGERAVTTDGPTAAGAGPARVAGRGGDGRPPALPLGRDSVAGGHLGWAFWVKDVVEGLDAVFAGCMVMVAWALWRDGIVSSRILGLLGMAGGTVFLVFSLGIPLTPALISMDVAHALIPAVPVVGVLASASWRSDPACAWRGETRRTTRHTTRTFSGPRWAGAVSTALRRTWSHVLEAGGPAVSLLDHGVLSALPVALCDAPSPPLDCVPSAALGQDRGRSQVVGAASLRRLCRRLRRPHQWCKRCDRFAVEGSNSCVADDEKVWFHHEAI